MENFNPDPKPGRLILPLVLIGMIATHTLLLIELQQIITLRL